MLLLTSVAWVVGRGGLFWKKSFKTQWQGLSQINKSEKIYPSRPSNWKTDANHIKNKKKNRKTLSYLCLVTLHQETDGGRYFVNAIWRLWPPGVRRVCPPFQLRRKSPTHIPQLEQTYKNMRAQSLSTDPQKLEKLKRTFTQKGKDMGFGFSSLHTYKYNYWKTIPRCLRWKKRFKSCRLIFIAQRHDLW